MKKTSLQSLMILFIMFAAIFEMKINAQSWNQILKSVAYQRDASDYYGSSVSISGNYAIVGVSQDDHDGSELNYLSNAGSAYLLKKDVFGSWTQIKKIVASDRATDDNFGHAVAISGDYAIVGAYNEDEDAGGGMTLSGAGSAYIFKKDQGGADSWGQVQKIVADDRAADDVFGQTVAISGEYAIVGAYMEEDDAAGENNLMAAGSAYIFKKDQGGINAWGQIQKIVADDRAAIDLFGYSVAISGEYAIVGAYTENENAAGGNTLSSAGSAYIFKKDQGGADNWGQVQKIVADDRAAGDLFGYSVAISGDYAIVGAYGEDHDASGNNILDYSGSAYIFKKDQGGIDAWGQIQKIVAADREANDNFGYSVAISGDYAIVGAYSEDSNYPLINNDGSAYIFKKNQGGIDAWGQVQKIVAADRGADDNFGRSVAISGKYAQVAAIYEDADINYNNEGAAYLFLSNTPPTGGNNTVTAIEDTVRTFTRSDFTYHDGDSDSFSGIKITGLVSKGNLKYNGVDVILNQQISDITKLEYSPVFNEFGPLYTSFKFKVNDGAEFSSAEYAMTIDVTEANHIPVVKTNTGCTVDEGGVFTFNDLYLFSTDRREPSYSLVYNITQAPVYGSLTKNGTLMKTNGSETSSFTQNDIANGKVKYTHNGEESNEDYFMFTVSDSVGNKSAEKTFTIAINGVNDPPTVDTLEVITMNEDEEYILDFTNWYDAITDIDNADSTLIISVSCANAKVTLSSIENNKCNINTDENYFGEATLNVTISDGELSCQTSVELIIESVNDLPVLNGLASSYTIQNGNIEIIELSGLAEDVETPDTSLAWSYSSTPDSLNIFYDHIEHAVVFGAKGGFEGNVEMVIKVTDEDGGTDEATITITVTPDPTSIEGVSGVPKEYTLFQNYPNPFNPSTVIRYGIPADVGNGLSPFRNVSLKIYDILGNEVATLVNGQQSPGYYERTWKAINNASGIYFYILNVGDFREVHKMILLK